MYTFTELINERIILGVDGNVGRGEYTEVFIDPTTSELRTLGPARGKNDGQFDFEVRDLAARNGINPPFYHFGGILANNHWYVFDRDSASHAYILKELKSELRGQTGVPFYGYFFPSSPTFLFLSLASYSMGDKEVNFKAVVRAHPKLKPFSVLVVP